MRLSFRFSDCDKSLVGFRTVDEYWDSHQQMVVGVRLRYLHMGNKL